MDMENLDTVSQGDLEIATDPKGSANARSQIADETETNDSERANRETGKKLPNEVSTTTKSSTLAAAKQNHGPVQNPQVPNSTGSTGGVKTGISVAVTQVAGSGSAASSHSTPNNSSNATQLSRKPRTFPEDLKPWEYPVNMVTVADELAAFIRKYCVLPHEEVDAVVLWIISSYLINSFRIFAKLSLISPEKRCGKTTAMEVIMSTCKDAVLASNLSPAVIYRITQQCQPTLLIDEADTFVKGGDPQLVGLINSSHNKSGATVIKCEGDDHTARAYSSWMAMVLASIGNLPPTIMDRSVVIQLRRKKSSDPVERLPGNLLDSQEIMRRKILRWCLDHLATVEANHVEPPGLGNDRAADNWVPLFTIAAEIGGHWSQKCESAYRRLTEVSERELPTQLLADIRDIFDDHANDRISSQALTDKLLADPDRPWINYSHGRKLTARDVATLLEPYGIRPRMIRFSQTSTKRGYKTQQFEDAFERYL